MKKYTLLKVIAVIAITFSMTSCFSPYYTVSLKTVESPADAKKQFGETKIITTQEKSGNVYTYEDDYIEIKWFVGLKQFNFDLMNKTEHTIKINWDDISYVDYNGSVCRVMHSGVKYTDRNNSQPATTIPKKTSLSDILLPTNNVYWSGDNWVEKRLVPKGYGGSTLQILMPILINGIQNDYIFTFSLEELIQDTNY